MTVKTAAQKLELAPATVYALCAAGRIRHERHGLGRGTIRITEAALDEYRRSRTVGAEEASVPPQPPKLRLKNLQL
jgi:excisionase family DNA binding protein